MGSSSSKGFLTNVASVSSDWSRRTQKVRERLVMSCRRKSTNRCGGDDHREQRRVGAVVMGLCEKKRDGTTGVDKLLNCIWGSIACAGLSYP
ncbi:hypothetical protein U1Q18_030316 [Sarracenia purpurea var. burkii]